MLKSGGYKCFAHVKAVLCKLLRLGKWTTPWGFKKYSHEGRAQEEHRAASMAKHLYQKSAIKAKEAYMRLKKEWVRRAERKPSKKELTLEAYEKAKRIKALTKLKEKGRSGGEALLEQLVQELHQCFLEGANREKIINFLKST